VKAYLCVTSEIQYNVGLELEWRVTVRSYQYNRTNKMHYLLSVYLIASTCFERFLLIIRRYCIYNNWYILCILCQLVTSKVEVEQNIPIVVYIVPCDNDQISAQNM
jgi:hypothetical protein